MPIALADVSALRSRGSDDVVAEEGASGDARDGVIAFVDWSLSCEQWYALRDDFLDACRRGTYRNWEVVDLVWPSLCHAARDGVFYQRAHPAHPGYADWLLEHVTGAGTVLVFCRDPLRVDLACYAGLFAQDWFRLAVMKPSGVAVVVVPVDWQGSVHPLRGGLEEVMIRRFDRFESSGNAGVILSRATRSRSQSIRVERALAETDRLFLGFAASFACLLPDHLDVSLLNHVYIRCDGGYCGGEASPSVPFPISNERCARCIDTMMAALDVDVLHWDGGAADVRHERRARDTDNDGDAYATERYLSDRGPCWTWNGWNEAKMAESDRAWDERVLRDRRAAIRW